MEHFSQGRAARVSGYDERAFRALVERGIILATPETRKAGRGKARTFDRHEVRVASVMNMLNLSLSVYELGRVADWLRRELATVARQSSEDHPYYVVIGTGANDSWHGSFQQARGDYRYVGGETKESDDRKISIMVEGEGSKKYAAPRLIVVNVTSALWWDDDEIIDGIIQDNELENAPAVAVDGRVEQ